MPQIKGQQPVFRFAPSPNGRLHLGHALSAFLNHDMARAADGLYLVRIEDIDQSRSSPEFQAGILEDLQWLDLSSDLPERRQSDHLPDYRDALDRLKEMGLVYPAFLSRGEVKAMVSDWEKSGNSWPRDPDGAPLYPDIDRKRSESEIAERLARGERHTLRLDMRKALTLLNRPLAWTETGDGPRGRIDADPARWGDVVLSRSDAPYSYTLSVVVDDAAQNVSHVVRGLDLYHATSVQRLLQELLGLPVPVYHHHRLILGPDGRKLSKSNRSTALASLREGGLTPSDIRRLVGA
jgi:glutamyl-Q tRNA(Asp) synthetase